MADQFVNELCGPKPIPQQYLKRNGNVKWTAYNKANTRWLKCAKTSARQDPENVAARAEAAASIGGSIADAAGRVGVAFAGGETVDLTDSTVAVDASPLATYLPWIAGAGALYLLIGK